ncbi:MAG: Bax inhibitor-1/YccA family protein [Alphaproteobacteria bacterium]|nr:Bax inhibitor-1/YccA family protein [Alphaproteobacteria bacterium]
MSNDFNDPISRTSTYSMPIDAGLRSYMISVYNYMAMALGLTGLVAFFVASQPALVNAIFGTPLAYVIIFAPLVMVYLISANLTKYKFQTVQTLFWVYAALMGLSLSSIFMIYAMGSIAKMFLITSSVFGAMSIYGYTTQKDLTSWGTFLFMGVVGILIAMIVNLFLQSGPLDYALSVITVLIFTGLVAYDTQTIKSFYNPNDSAEKSGKFAIYGAMQLYIDFINIFLALLRLFGDRR